METVILAMRMYQPRNVGELTDYIAVVFGHWRIKDSHPNQFNEVEAVPTRLILKSLNAAVIDILLVGR